MEQIRRIMRPTDVPDQGLLCDLLWSDPDKDTLGWGENDRGVSFTFGVEVNYFFLFKYNLIFRYMIAHDSLKSVAHWNLHPLNLLKFVRVHICSFVTDKIAVQF